MDINTTNQPLFYTTLMKKLWRLCSRDVGIWHLCSSYGTCVMAPGYGSRTKLAQVYPYRFCSKLLRCLLPLGSHRGLFHAQTRQSISTISRTTTTITVSTCCRSSTYSRVVFTFDSCSTRHSCCSNSCRSSYYS